MYVVQVYVNYHFNFLLLKVNSVINVGISAYTQLQKLKGQEIDATDSDKAKNNVCVVCMRASRRKN